MPDILSPPPVQGGGMPDGVVTGARPERRPPASGRAAPASAGVPLVSFTGSGWELLKIYLRNIVFIILTLGIYSFWGKVRVRQYLWENTHLLGEPLEYTGTGGELFRSFLLAMLLMFMGSLIFYGFSTIHPAAGSLAAILAATPAVHFATYQALRYRLSRTRWRGIRGNMAGRAVRYTGHGCLYSLLTALTLGICHPLAVARLTSLRANNMYFGSRAFSFSGGSRDLFIPWVVAWLAIGLPAGAAIGMIAAEEGGYSFSGMDMQILEVALFPVMLVAGLAYIGFKALRVRWFFRNLAYGEMRFDAASYTMLSLLWVSVSNYLLVLVTLGLAMPWAELRALRLYLGAVTYTGEPRYEEIAQDTRPDKARGEGLLDALDADIAF